MAHAFEILGLKDESEPNYKDRFELKEESWVEPQVILGDDVFLPYAIDSATREFIFTDTSR